MEKLQEYRELLVKKHVAFKSTGLKNIELHDALFPHQRDVVQFAADVGRSAALLNTGLGKTFVALNWADAVSRETGKPVLMLAPLAVSQQHEREADHFGFDAKAIRDPSELIDRTNITNYERLKLFDPSVFAGVVLDESGILKSFGGKTKNELISSFRHTPFRLACTATPAPNDHMELGNHSEFLGVMKSNEMLSRWFINDTSMASQKWRLKGHARENYWSWVASWSRMLSMPSDLGYSNDGYDLEPLDIRHHEIKADISQDTGEFLFRIPVTSATGIHAEKRRTIADRAKVIADLVNEDAGETWIVWTETDYEADAIMKLIPDAVEVRGSMKPELKEKRLMGFVDGDIRVLVTKPRIAGFGLNLQHCARVAFVGLDFSFEKFYQAIRRCWRFGQKRQVQVHIAMSDTERSIWAAVNRKQKGFEEMQQEMLAAMKRSSMSVSQQAYDAQNEMKLPGFLK